MIKKYIVSRNLCDHIDNWKIDNSSILKFEFLTPDERSCIYEIYQQINGSPHLITRIHSIDANGKIEVEMPSVFAKNGLTHYDLGKAAAKVIYYAKYRDTFLGWSMVQKRQRYRTNKGKEYIDLNYEYIKHLNQKQWDVCGHWRNQRCGPGRSLIKRVWVKEYKKGHAPLKER
jgi:hypothetical protein